MESGRSTSGLLTETASKAVVLYPLAIPETQPDHYISFKHALNLRYPEEDTGDWHFQSAFFYQAVHPCQNHSIPLAGSGEAVDTTPSLGIKGVRDMAIVLAKTQIPIKPDQSVYVANHYRAIADLAMMELQQARIPSCATNQAINSWLDTAEQVEHLQQDYLEPMAMQLSGQALKVFIEWISTLYFT